MPWLLHSRLGTRKLAFQNQGHVLNQEIWVRQEGSRRGTKQGDHGRTYAQKQTVGVMGEEGEHSWEPCVSAQLHPGQEATGICWLPVDESLEDT